MQIQIRTQSTHTGYSLSCFKSSFRQNKVIKIILNTDKYLGFAHMA